MNTTRGRMFALAIATALLVGAADAAFLTVSTTAPAVDGADIASGLGAGDRGEKLWTDTRAIGQTFTTGSQDVVLDAITLQLWGSGQPTKTYTITVGPVSGNEYTGTLTSETFTQDASVVQGDYFTIHLANAVTLSANSLYGFDLAMNSSTSGWRSGIPYMASTANSVYPDGQAFTSTVNGQSTSPFGYTNSDKVFHLNLTPVGGPTPPPQTFTILGDSSGGSTWHFSSDPYLPDDPGGLVFPVTLGGGTQTASVTLPGEFADDPFYVVVEANDTGSPPSFAGVLVAPQGYVFDSNNNGSQDPGDTQFYSTEGAPFGPGRPEWTAGGSLAGCWYLTQDADEVGPAGNPFPAGTEAIWYGTSGGTVYLAAAVPQLVQGEWAPPTIEGSPESSVTTDPGITARVVRTDGMQLRNIAGAVDVLTYLGPNASGHYATSESPIPQLDIGNSGGSYPGSVAMLAPDHKTSGADGDDTAARFTGYVYIDPAWDTDPGSDFSYVRTFAVASADGFRLKVGDSTVLEFEGTRGMPGTPDLIPVNFPAPGYWPIELDWFNGTGSMAPAPRRSNSVRARAPGGTPPTGTTPISNSWGTRATTSRSSSGP